MKTAIITGASGMLGQALIRRLRAEKVQVYAVIRPDSPHNQTLEQYENVEMIPCDMSSLLKLPDQITEKVDAFFHFGWAGTYGQSRNNLYGQWENVKYTLDAVEAAKALGCEVFLGAGSQAEFGRVEEGIKLSSKIPANPETGYGMAKLSAGQMSRLLCKEYGIRHIWTRILSVYGPGDKDRTMVMSGIVSMLQGQSPQYTKGEQLWDYLYCDDAADAFYLAAEKGKDGAIYCVGSGKERMLRDYILDIGKATNPELEICLGAVPYFDKQVMYLCADLTELTEDTGFVPKTTFAEGIAKTVEWRRKQTNM